MDCVEDDILHMFIEDTRDHLADIETSLMDLERDGSDEELINKVFRAAHSIKGGAGFLNLRNVRDLAHKLENLLHLARNQELAISKRLINALLAGFDLLLSLVEQGVESDGRDISAVLEELSGLTRESAPEEEQESIDAPVTISLPGHDPIFVEDLFNLRQSLKGGKLLYLVKYDLIHDVQARGKTPLDVIAAMESSGLIIDCKMDIEAVGDLSGPLTNAIPFYVLFATIVEPDVISYLFAIDSKRIELIDLDKLAGEDAAEAPPEPVWTPVDRVAARIEDGTVRLALAGQADAQGCRNLLAALIQCLDKGANAVLDMPELTSVPLRLLQILAAAGAGFARQDAKLTLSGQGAKLASQAAARAGFTPGALAGAGVPDGLFANPLM